MKKRSCLKRLIQFASALVVLLILLAWGFFYYPLQGIPFNAQRHGNPPLTPAWALECWVWEDDTNTAESTLEMVNGHIEHDFPVRTILIDSPWSTRYNDFVVDEARFPNPEAFFTSLDERDIRVVLWMTSMVNSRSKDTAIEVEDAWYKTAADQGFLLGNNFQKEWWKGYGGFIDYSNPDAMVWWHGLQQNVLDWGIDGWKLDGSASLAFANVGPAPWFYVNSHEGIISTRSYVDHYYRDEYAHGLTQNPEFITLSRSLDSVVLWAHPEGTAPIDASPVNWVGDNKHTWTKEERGLQRAIRLILESSELGYNIVGSDIAGYHGGTLIDPDLYIRWTQFSTFCGLFLNGGHGERRMWKRSEEELKIIREFSWLHHELVPYMYHYVLTAHEGGRRLMKPLDDGPYHYLFGEDILVAPIVAPGTSHTVSLPEGRWRYWFDDREVIEGPKTFSRNYPLDEYPVFVRDGAILPMNISRDYTGIGDASWSDYLTFNIYPGVDNYFDYFKAPKSTAMTVHTLTEGDLQVGVAGQIRPYLLRIFLDKAPVSLSFNGTPFSPEQWSYNAETQRLLIKSSDVTPGSYLVYRDRHL